MWWLWLFVFALMNAQGTLQQRAQYVEPVATQEVASNLKVVGVYGARVDTTSDLHLLKINVELSAGSLPRDLSMLVIRYSGGASVANYGWTEADVASEPGPSSGFATTWIRGTGSDAMMNAGDLVELQFVLPQDLPERTAVQVSLIPETGSPVQADFKTPPTYGYDLVITLR